MTEDRLNSDRPGPTGPDIPPADYAGQLEQLNRQVNVLQEQVKHLQAENTALKQKLPRQDRPEPEIPVPAGMTAISDHGLPAVASAAQIAAAVKKATGKKPAHLTEALLAAVRQEPSIARRLDDGRTGYEIYSLLLWRFTGYRFVPPQKQ